MCHLILMMPVIGLGVFWILPFSVALPLYLVIVAVSGFIYFKIMRAMKHRPESGTEAMIGHTVEVIETSGHSSRVIFDGEIWEAESDELLKKGEQVEILAVKGLTLRVGKPPDDKIHPVSVNHSTYIGRENRHKI